MKKIYVYVALLAALSFVACDDFDHEAAPPQSYEQEAEQSVDGFTFTLGSGLASAIVLTEEDLANETVLEAVNTTATPELAEGAYLTFKLEVSDTQEFTSSVELPSVSAENTATVAATDLDEAVKSLYGKAPEARELYVRASYYIVDGTASVRMPNPAILGPVTVTPVGSIKDIIYMTGNAITGLPEWSNEESAIGNGLQVLFADNSSTDSKYTFTAHFTGEREQKFPIQAGVWNPCWGYKDGALVLEDNSPNLPGPATSGYYTLNLDLETLTAEYIPYTGDVSVTYSSMGVIGPATTGGWDSDTDLTQVTDHIWTSNAIELTAGELKIRANDAWDVSWGPISEDDQSLPFGKGTTDNGKNIKIETAGTYYIALNDLTGHYIIIPTSELP